jgi:hypothetical protein
MYILHCGISGTEKKTGSFGSMPFLSIKAIRMNKDNKFSRWDLSIARLNE